MCKSYLYRKLNLYYTFVFTVKALTKVITLLYCVDSRHLVRGRLKSGTEEEKRQGKSQARRKRLEVLKQFNQNCQFYHDNNGVYHK